MRKAHDWQPVIGPTKVGELLRHWRAAEAQTAAAVAPQPPPPEGGPEPERPQPIVQHADMPGKTYNIDLFFVPEEHLISAPTTAQATILAAAPDRAGPPAASPQVARPVEPAGPATGSGLALRPFTSAAPDPAAPAAVAQDGRASTAAPALAPATPTTGPTETAVSGAAATQPNSAPPAPVARTYPGQAFQAGRDYNTNMAEYAQRRQAQLAPLPKPAPAPAPEAQALAEAQRQLKHEGLQLRFQRSALRQQRQREDAAHRAARQTHDQHQAAWRQLTPDEQAGRQAENQAAEATWQQQRQTRHEQNARRTEEDATWRQQRTDLRTRQADLAAQHLAWLARGLLAVLLVVDNCTREAVALVLLTAGLAVSAEMVVAALAPLLPATLQYLVSDNGKQFTAQVMAALLAGRGIVHVRIAPRRPRTNGIAERLVRTIKELLATHNWHGASELEGLLPPVQTEYNERPHQGKELKGLSPNEFKRRLLASGAT